MRKQEGERAWLVVYDPSFLFDLLVTTSLVSSLESVAEGRERCGWGSIKDGLKVNQMCIFLV